MEKDLTLFPLFPRENTPLGNKLAYDFIGVTALFPLFPLFFHHVKMRQVFSQYVHY
jgi:hypothetical protein